MEKLRTFNNGAFPVYEEIVKILEDLELGECGEIVIAISLLSQGETYTFTNKEAINKFKDIKSIYISHGDLKS